MIAWLCLGAALAAPIRPGTVAVLPFAEGDALPGGLGHALSAMVVEDLSARAGWTVVERARLSDVIAEIELGQGRYVDPATAAPLGQLLGVSRVVTGTWTVLGDKLVVEARAVDTTTAEVLAVAVSDGPLDRFADVEQALFDKLVGPGPSGAHPADLASARAFGEGLSAEARGDLEAARAAWTRALAADPGFGPVQDGLSRADALLAHRAATRDEGAAAVRSDAVRKVLEACPFVVSPVDEAGWACLSARWVALEAEGRWCQKADEMGRVGEPRGYVLPHSKGLVPAVEKILAPVGGVAGLGVKRDRWTLGWEGAYEFVLGSFPVFYDGHWDGLAQTLARCGPPEAALAEVDRVYGRLRRQGASQASRDVRSNPVPLLAAIEAWSIREDARANGFSDRLGRRAEGLLAAFPVSSKEGKELEDVVAQARRDGANTARRQRSRLGLSPDEVVAVWERLAQLSGVSAACAPLVGPAQDRAKEALRDRAKAEDFDRVLDRTAQIVAPVVDFGCWPGQPGATPGWDAVVARIRALPASPSLDCADGVEGLRRLDLDPIDAQLRLHPELAGLYATGPLLQWTSLAIEGCVGPLPAGKPLLR